MVIITVFFIGCIETTNNISDEERRFVGEWNSEVNPKIIPVTLILNSDGTANMGGLISTWELKNGQLIISASEFEFVSNYDYFFTENDTILHLRLEGNDVFDVYLKQYD